jgi:hypothetical protein
VVQGRAITEPWTGVVYQENRTVYDHKGGIEVAQFKAMGGIEAEGNN